MGGVFLHTKIFQVCDYLVGTQYLKQHALKIDWKNLRKNGDFTFQNKPL